LRALMGVGGAAVLPVSLAIITVVFPREERGRAIGIWAGAVGGAVALGPVLGGLLLAHPEWSEWLTGNAWGSVFLINVPIVAIGVVGIMRVVPETGNPNPRGLDVGGLVVSAVGLFSLVFGIIHASEVGSWIDPLVLVPIASGVGILATFVVMEARSDHASFDVSLFTNRGFSVSLTAVSLAFFALSGITFTLPFFLQVVRGYDTLQAGLCFIPFAAGQLLAAPRSSTVVGRFGYRPVMTIGLLVVGGACLGIAAMDVETPLWVILTVFFAFGFGMGNVMAPASTLIQNSLPLAQAGAGSAVQNTVRQVGGALGVAVIGTLLATTYAAAANQTLSDLPDEARDRAATSIVATEVILDSSIDAGMPADQVERLREAAYQDFLDASHITSLISAGFVTLAALVVVALLPTIRPPEQVQREADAALES
ncbi:MAG: MFS transporter, partial [Actinomycetia bacterium]|nr:MFS transporter [Actinomycetes bacterium]